MKIMKMFLITIMVVVAINVVTKPLVNKIGMAALPLVFIEVAITRPIGQAINLISPEALAVIEHVTNRDILYVGRCRIDNIRGIEGNGILLFGDFKRSDGIIEKHVRGYKDDTIIEKTCKECTLKSVDAVLLVENYEIIEIEKHNKDISTKLNLRYIKGAIWTNRLLSMWDF